MMVFMVKGEGEFPTLQDTQCVFASTGAKEIAQTEEGSRMVRLFTEELTDDVKDYFIDWGWAVVAQLTI